jgi:predicted protein tyrosine phosphatase
MAEQPNFLRFFQDSVTPMHEIEEGLFLGSLDAAKNKELLKSCGITHLVSILDSFSYMPVFEDLSYYRIELPDSSNADILAHVPNALNFISQALKQGRVLVHCAAGVSRSASMVIAYIMVKYSYTFDVAKSFVKNKRGCIWPNPGFQRQIGSINPEEYRKYLN